MCAGGEDAAVQPLLPPLPRVKISGRVAPDFAHLAASQSAEIRGKDAPVPRELGTTPTAAMIRYSEQKFETWLFERSLITRVSGVRMHRKRTSVEIDDASSVKLADVPYSFVIAYDPPDFTTPTDFPVRYFDDFSDDMSSRLTSMTDVSITNSEWYPHWMLKWATLGAQGLPEGTTTSRVVEAGHEVLNIHFPAKRWSDDYMGEQRIAAQFAPGKITMELYSRGWSLLNDGRSQPELMVHKVAYSKFKSEFTGIPWLAEIQSMRGTRLTARVTSVEPIAEDSTFEQVLNEARKGLPRVFINYPDHEPLTSTSLTQFDGQPIRWSDYGGKFLLLHFWTSWAPDNDKRFAEMRRIVKKHGVNPEFAAIGINFDAYPQMARNVLNRVRPTWPQVYVGADTKIASRFPFQTLPAVILLDKDTKEDMSYRLMLGPESSVVEGRAEKAVTERLALENRRRRAGGVHAELMTDAGRDALLNAPQAEAFLLAGTVRPSDPAFEIPRGAPQFLYQPVLFQWPDLPRSATREIAKLLLDDSNYTSHHGHSDHYHSDVHDRLIGLRFTHKLNHLSLLVEPRGRVSLEARSPTKTVQRPVFLSVEAVAHMNGILEPYLPRDARTTAAIERRLEEWRSLRRRRLQDTITSESLVPPVRVTEVWPGRAAIQLEWENPDQRKILIIRGDKRGFDALPEHGREYRGGEKIGEGVVVYAGTDDRYLDRKLKNGRSYYYKIYVVADDSLYSSATPIRASAGDGMRSINSQTMSEMHSDRGSSDSWDDFEIIRYDTSYLLRLVSKPGQKEIKAIDGKVPVILREDAHPPIGGASTYTARMHYGNDQQMRQLE